jgi:hypothetical protein
MKNKKGLIGFISFVIACVVAIVVLVFVLSSTTVSDTDTVASVNGYKISAGELKMIMSTQKGYIIEEYGKDFSQIDDAFWNAQVGNTTPIKELRKRALETLVRYKVEQQIAIDNGIITKEQASFESFLDSLNKENQSRSAALESNQNIGVTEYTQSTYFEYIYGNNTYVYEEEDCGEGSFCVWQNCFDKESGLCDFKLTVFERDDDSKAMYARRDEEQCERCYSKDEIINTLQKNKFELVGIYSDFKFTPASDTDERWYVVARAKK